MSRNLYEKAPAASRDTLSRPLLTRSLTDDMEEKDDLRVANLDNIDLSHSQQPPLRIMTNTAPPPVTWMSLPRRGQLAILFLSRFVDFLQVASLQAYVFYQLKAIDQNGSATPRSDAAISTQAGLLQGCFTGAQVLTAMLWGKAADASWCGRKPVLFIGLFGTAISCIGYGFATTFFWAAFWRAIGGGINGTVGIIRTMISEIIKDKKYQSRAFLILPMSFNLANMIGPIMGGFLADPANTLPSLFGDGAIFGFQWIQAYPFALPSVLNAVSLGLSAMVVLFCLEETSKDRRGKFDYGLYLTARFQQIVLRRRAADGYTRVDFSDVAVESVPMLAVSEKIKKPASQGKLPFTRIWTRNVILTLVTARTFTLPASIILLNNCSPHPSVLGTIHGLGQSTSAGFRTIGPVVGGWWYGWGLQHGAVEAGWWGVAAMSMLGCVSALWIYEGSGHEISLEGDETESQEADD
ncbi:mfs transporter [Ophiostoma piceae UAMH 11346]|uniref:Mfs transporter n=1 Tax=Ophiostoma piceae (strain UAMH 11346) TaxID=1262450 RepID=S3BRU8_OPHP1|nr:mfs transporter [Ophiostoma piceae UAMH 11346]